MKKTIAAILMVLMLLPVFTGCMFVAVKEPAKKEKEQYAVVTGSPKGELDFETVDINGDPISMSMLSEKKLVMVNFWEPWCGPCVGELPALQKLYEKYSDRGFVILGVYGSSEESEARTTAESIGITYPVFFVTEEFQKYQTRYVPTTVFFNGNGDLLTDEPYVGSKSESEWEDLILSFLGD